MAPLSCGSVWLSALILCFPLLTLLSPAWEGRALPQVPRAGVGHATVDGPILHTGAPSAASPNVQRQSVVLVLDMQNTAARV